MSIKQIGIKFCGGCNPRIDRGRIAGEIRDFFVSGGYEVVYNSLDADFIVYLSGCTANCARRYSKCQLPGVVVAANTIDAVVVEIEELGIQTIGKVRGYLE